MNNHSQSCLDLNRICEEDLSKFFERYPSVCGLCRGWGEVVDAVLGALHTMDCPKCVGHLRCGLCGGDLNKHLEDPGTPWYGYWDGKPCAACGWNVRIIAGPPDPPGCICDFEEDPFDLPF